MDRLEIKALNIANCEVQETLSKLKVWKGGKKLWQ
jgi:hypothetical protein